MKCKDALDLVHGYTDGELDLEKSLEIEQHLGACASCKVQYDHVRELGSAIRAHALYHAAPRTLRGRVAASLPRDAGAGARNPPWRWWGMAAGMLLSAVLGLGLSLEFLHNDAKDRLLREVVAGHVRSLMANHLMDIASSDQHSVKPWIAGKLEFSPPVEDLSAQGFALAGGRLDYLNERDVMALVYRRHGHVINLFVWPDADGADSPLHSDSYRGYNLVHFSRAGMVFWAVSDLNAEELMAYAALL